jgi:hypothetical protein
MKYVRVLVAAIATLACSAVSGPAAAQTKDGPATEALTVWKCYRGYPPTCYRVAGIGAPMGSEQVDSLLSQTADAVGNHSPGPGGNCRIVRGQPLTNSALVIICGR